MRAGQAGECCGRTAGDPTERDGREQSVAGQIAPDARAGNASRRAAACEDVRKRLPVRPQHARLAIDLEAALGMEERAGDLYREIWRRELRLAGEVAAEGIHGATR